MLYYVAHEILILYPCHGTIKTVVVSEVNFCWPETVYHGHGLHSSNEQPQGDTTENFLFC